MSMDMNKVKIMAVAPYEGLRDLLRQTVSGRDDVELSVFLGDLSEGAEQVRAAQSTGYDVILSRGGTAEMISGVTNIPVVEIDVSGFDVLRSIRLAQNYSGTFAIVGFPSITNSARTLCDLLQYDISIFTIKSGGEVRDCLSKLASDGFTMIVGDTVVANAAKCLGVGGVLITSGPESVRQSLDNAVKLSRQLSRSRSRESLYKKVLEGVSQHVTVFNKSGQEIFSNPPRVGEQPLTPGTLEKYIPELEVRDRINISLKKDSALWSLRGMKFGEYAAFYAEKTIEAYDGEIFRTLSPAEVIPDPIESFYGGAEASANPSLKARSCGEYPRPVFIHGEYGVGKETIAKIVHLNSQYRDYPMVIVDCSLVDGKKWNLVLEGKGSLMALKGFTVFIKNLQHIPQDVHKKLEARLSGTPISRDNRLIFSLTEQGGIRAQSHLRDYLLEGLGCVTICPPPLRERKHDIPSLASLYIGAEKQKQLTTVIGFEKKAMDAMKQFDWPRNVTQLKHILRELLLITKSSYISENDVLSVLGGNGNHSSGAAPVLAFEGTLEEIITKAIHAALEAENMNQTKAAARLGISRSTLWKRLKGE
jgi:transcriptional regulator with PAS, ATPase and Fis domain